MNRTRLLRNKRPVRKKIVMVRASFALFLFFVLALLVPGFVLGNFPRGRCGEVGKEVVAVVPRCQGVQVWRKSRFVVVYVWGIGKSVGVFVVGPAVVDAECRMQNAAQLTNPDYSTDRYNLVQIQANWQRAH